MPVHVRAWMSDGADSHRATALMEFAPVVGDFSRARVSEWVCPFVCVLSRHHIVGECTVADEYVGDICCV